MYLYVITSLNNIGFMVGRTEGFGHWVRKSLRYTEWLLKTPAVTHSTLPTNQSNLIIKRSHTTWPPTDIIDSIKLKDSGLTTPNLLNLIDFVCIINWWGVKIKIFRIIRKRSNYALSSRLCTTLYWKPSVTFSESSLENRPVSWHAKYFKFRRLI